MKRWIAAVSLTVLCVAAGLSSGQIPENVNAAELDPAVYTRGESASSRWDEETYAAFLENSPYGPYEKLTEAQRNTYTKIQQYFQKLQQWKQERLPFTEPRDFEAEAAEAARLAAEEEARRLEEEARLAAEEQARLEEELRKVWHNPLPKFSFVSSRFGWRVHPVKSGWQFHNGIDLAAGKGTEIYAARGGIVVAAGWHDDYGYYVRIDHGDGFKSEYFHMSKYCVKKGQEVEAGDLIGKVGSTGMSTGNHLHFGIILNDEHVNPADYIDFTK